MIRDAETKYGPASKSGGGWVPGSTCVLRACFLNTAVSLSPAFPLSTHQREPIPPPPSHPRSPVVDGGFPRPIVSLYLLSSVDPVARQSVAEYIGMCAKGQSTVGWFWLWPPKPPSASDLLCLCPEVSRNGQTMWLKSRQQPKLLRTSWEEPKIMPKSLKNGMVYLKFKTSMIAVESCNFWKKMTLTLCQKEKECRILNRSARLNWKTGCKGGPFCFSEFALV